MRHIAIAITALLALGGTAAAQDRYLEADHADVVRLPAPAYTVVIGNPSVADAVIHDRSTLILTGRLHGRTNVIALDARGRVIYAQEVIVGGSPEGGVTLYRGANRTTYACGANCEAMPTVGDPPASLMRQVQTVAGRKLRLARRGQHRRAAALRATVVSGPSAGCSNYPRSSRRTRAGGRTPLCWT